MSCVRTLLFHPGIDVNLKKNQGRTAMRNAGGVRIPHCVHTGAENVQ